MENLVQLFNAESHAIGIKPAHGIDDAVVQFVFDKCVGKKIDMYICYKHHWVANYSH